MNVEIFAEPSHLSFAPENTLQEIIQNVKVICSTIIGTLPLRRDFGINGNILDLPTDTAKAMISAEIYSAVKKWEPRVRIERIDFYASDYGVMTPKLLLSIQEETL